MWEDTTKEKKEPEVKQGFDGVKIEKEKSTFDKYFKQDGKPKAFVTLFFGDTGCGKTYTAFTFPEPIYVIDTESRAISTKYYNFKDKNINIFEPVQLKTEFDPKDSDALDTHSTINNISKFVIDIANQVKKGKITKGTIIVDSVTDIWSLCQDWGMHELAKYTNKDGSKKADIILMKVKNQMDWGMITKKHHEILGILRTLIKHGIHIVFTAREQNIPDYAKEKTASVKDKIRSQKDVPFLADVIFHLKKVKGQKETKFWADNIKLSGKMPVTEYIENLDYKKIDKLLEDE